MFIIDYKCCKPLSMILYRCDLLDKKSKNKIKTITNNKMTVQKPKITAFLET